MGEVINVNFKRDVVNTLTETLDAHFTSVGGGNLEEVLDLSLSGVTLSQSVVSTPEGGYDAFCEINKELNLGTHGAYAALLVINDIYFGTHSTELLKDNHCALLLLRSISEYTGDQIATFVNGNELAISLFYTSDALPDGYLHYSKITFTRPVK